MPWSIAMELLQLFLGGLYESLSTNNFNRHWLRQWGGWCSCTNALTSMGSSSDSFHDRIVCSVLLHINELRNAFLLKVFIHKTDTSWHPKGGFVNLSEFHFGLSPSAIFYKHILPPSAFVSKGITILTVCLLGEYINIKRTLKSYSFCLASFQLYISHKTLDIYVFRSLSSITLHFILSRLVISSKKLSTSSNDRRHVRTAQQKTSESSKPLPYNQTVTWAIIKESSGFSVTSLEEKNSTWKAA